MISIHANKPVLIAGPTASGKSALALHIAAAQGGVIINADALQVYSGWNVITARPNADDLSAAPHHLYGHVPFDQPYSTGHWLRDVRPYLAGGPRPIIVGGTGLNFHALLNGLAEIPSTPSDLRSHANTLTLKTLLSELDDQTAARIDTKNRMRVQRAWEVLKATGKPISQWQDETPPPLLAAKDTTRITLNSPVDWLNTRIETRFDMMLDQGALDEARAMLPHWNPQHQSAKAIGAPELISHLKGELTLDEAREAAIIASRQYAKRQRTWFRSKHKDWHQLDVSSTDLPTAFTFLP